MESRRRRANHSTRVTSFHVRHFRADERVVVYQNRRSCDEPRLGCGVAEVATTMHPQPARQEERFTRPIQELENYITGKYGLKP